MLYIICTWCMFRNLIFIMFNSNEMFWQSIYISQFKISVNMFKFWIVFACLNRVRCSMYHFVLNSINICFEMFLSKYSIKCILYSIVRSNAFHIDNSMRKLFCFTNVFFLNSTKRTNNFRVIIFYFRFFCQCERDILKIFNFCFTIAHEILNNKRFKTLKIVDICFYQIRKHVFVQSFYWLNSKIHVLLILLYLSTITFVAQSKTKTKSFEHEVFFYWNFFEKHNFQKKNEIIYRINFSLLKIQIRNFFLVWNLFEHEIFVFWCVSYQTI